MTGESRLLVRIFLLVYSVIALWACRHYGPVVTKIWGRSQVVYLIPFENTQ